MITTNPGCRICKHSELHQFLSLGPMALANSFLTQEQLAAAEPKFPLDVYLCSECSLVQLRDIVDPELMFRNYVYSSSTSESFRAHFRAFAEDVHQRFGLSSESLVIDIGSNDGILLKPFQQLGTRVLGIDPAENIAKMATEAGIETLPVFFNIDTAREVKASRGRAHVITATNVFAHVNDLDAFLSALKEVLRDDGVFIFEVPYLADLLENNLFDTIYHEHLSYFSFKPLLRLFQNHAMEILDVQNVSSHGGSIRVFTGKSQSGSSIQSYLEREKELGLYSLETWQSFAQRVATNREKLRQMIRNLRAGHKRIVGYGAPAKGNILLNYFHITDRDLDFIVDDSPLKQGLYTPGTHIPVCSSDRFREDFPDYVLLLAWNFAGPIMKKLQWYSDAGGRFIIPVPEPEIVAR